MPNLCPPITSIKSALSYKERIIASLPDKDKFTPLMTVYLTEEISPILIKEGFRNQVFTAAKLYPANATTNSSKGVSDLKKINPILEVMEKIDMPLLIHGEVVDKEIDVFDREAVFIERHLTSILQEFPKLRVVLEHITTENAIHFVEESKYRIAATITPHHLHINRNAMFDGGFRSDFYCLPVVKRECHRLALRKAATSGNPRFFLGTDSAPHTRHSKETSCGCAGIFNAPNAIESYTEVFEQESALSRLEGFASEYGSNFYQLPLNENHITLTKKKNIVPDYIEVKTESNGIERIIPFHAGEALNWQAEKI